ncbi:MAG: 4-hydroxy-tetrahydrodipicolinate synthase [Nitrospinae bacterium CG22_combo_CG10-13_8_21_14_all_47_10]|nr:MAG: 4-hydroxy-tetrahydrodipicolinate synthase [Nitrospinae bacterium CG22_combo_CG10-13_8_21_14_all_47_10]
MFEGSFVAIVTPFKNGKIDAPALRGLVEFHIENGTNGIVPCGTTGESATLNHAEHEEVIRIAVETCKGRIPVLAGTGSNATHEAIELTQRAQKIGADGALLITPYYNKPTQEGLFLHFSAVAKETDLPIMLYNVPGRTSINMVPSTVARLSAIKNIVGIKEASGSLVQVSEIIQSCGPDFEVISGEDALTWPILAIGGKGAISVTANLVPDKCARLYQAALSGDVETAKTLHYELLKLNDIMFIETNPIPVKTALGLMGRIENEFRAPLCAPSEEHLAQLKAVLKAYALI